MTNRNITSANSVLTLAVDGLYSAPVNIAGYATDRSFESQAVDTAEVQMGVDGKLSAGFVPVPVTVSITLQADSPSNEIFENWNRVEKAKRTKLKASMALALPATKRRYSGKNGVLVSYTPLPSGGKVLGPRAYTIVFESLIAESM